MCLTRCLQLVALTFFFFSVFILMDVGVLPAEAIEDLQLQMDVRHSVGAGIESRFSGRLSLPSEPFIQFPVFVFLKEAKVFQTCLLCALYHSSIIFPFPF